MRESINLEMGFFLTDHLLIIMVGRTREHQETNRHHLLHLRPVGQAAQKKHPHPRKTIVPLANPREGVEAPTSNKGQDTCAPD